MPGTDVRFLGDAVDRFRRTDPRASLACSVAFAMAANRRVPQNVSVILILTISCHRLLEKRS
jgi:hypothetical protein